MRAHASAAAAGSLRFVSWSVASFFSSAIFCSTSGVAHRLLLEQRREVVPARAALEQPAELLARLLVAAIDLADLLPGLDRRLDVAQLRLAQPGDVAQLLLARLDGDAGHARRREQHVAQIGVHALLAQVLLDPRERLGVRRLDLERLAELASAWGLRPFAAPRLGGLQRFEVAEPPGGDRRAARRRAGAVAPPGRALCGTRRRCRGIAAPSPAGAGLRIAAARARPFCGSRRPAAAGDEALPEGGRTPRIGGCADAGRHGATCWAAPTTGAAGAAAAPRRAAAARTAAAGAAARRPPSRAPRRP